MSHQLFEVSDVALNPVVGSGNVRPVIVSHQSIHFVHLKYIVAQNGRKVKQKSAEKGAVTGFTRPLTPHRHPPTTHPKNDTFNRYFRYMTNKNTMKLKFVTLLKLTRQNRDRVRAGTKVSKAAPY